MIARRAMWQVRPFGSLTRQTAEASIRTSISPSSMGRCKRMRMQGSTGCTIVAAFRRQPTGRMFGASSLICTRHMLRRSRPKPWNVSVLYMSSKAKNRGRSPDERQTRSRPRLISLQDWFKGSLTKLSRKSETAAAISYALGRCPALVRYCDDGLLEINNNAAERALRAVALGRKNYLFASSDSGGERAATIYSLIGSAKLIVWTPKRTSTMCPHALRIIP